MRLAEYKLTALKSLAPADKDGAAKPITFNAVYNAVQKVQNESAALFSGIEGAKEDAISKFKAKAMTASFLLSLSKEEADDYDKEATPGDEDKIGSLINDLSKSRLEEQVNKDSLDSQREQLMENIDQVVISQSMTKAALHDLKERLDKALDSQRLTLK